MTGLPSAAGRIRSIDALRGLVMILMALDHVRDFLHRGAMSQSPTDLATTTPFLFLTRWVTHLCAPSFLFTAGLGAFFWWHGRRTRAQLSGFLASRGLWLIVLELTVMRVAYDFAITTRYPTLVLVLWILGAAMILLAGVAWLPIRGIAALSVAIILLHNGLDGVTAAEVGLPAGLWNVLHQPGGFQVGSAIVIVGYPLLPWAAVMSLGFAFGPLFLRPVEERRRPLLVIGWLMIAGFLVLRGLNGYGDPAPWSIQPSTVDTVLSFLNTTKYPASLAYLLMMLGPALLLLAWFDRLTRSRSNPLVVFGRAPLFYFVAHFYLAHAAGVLLALAHHGSAALGFVFHRFPSMGGPAELFPAGFGYDLWVTYVAWGAVVMALYPACRWLAAFKERRREWWVSYL